MSGSVSNYLDKYKSIYPPELSIKSVVIEVIKKEIGVDVSKKHLTFDDGNVFVDTDSHIKNTILINKDKIIKKSNKKIGDAVIKKIF